MPTPPDSSKGGASIAACRPVRIAGWGVGAWNASRRGNNAAARFYLPEPYTSPEENTRDWMTSSPPFGVTFLKKQDG